MAQSIPFNVIVAALLISMLSCCSAENVYCVTPTATSCSSCPHNSTNCTTLSEYAQEAELYFTSNTTMVFLPGDHILDTNITVSNIARLTLRGESSSGDRATVVCSGSVGLSFTSMVEFKIHSLVLSSCSRLLTIVVLDDTLAVLGALHLHSTQHTELADCSFHDNMAYALVMNNTNITLSGNTEFTHNRAPSITVPGGGIIASDSNLTFTGNTTFLGNTGAIVTLNNTVLSFSGTSNFINNSGFGAIYTLGRTVLSFTGANNFIDNSAVYQGGAIATTNTVLSFNGTTYFISNSAPWGGAIYASVNSTLTFNGTIYFINNGYYGGVNIVDGYTFGGGVYMGLKCTFFILPNTTVYWENNHASLGGAIYVYDAIPASYCTILGPYQTKEECFFRLPGQNLSNGIDVHLVFKNNSADNAGSVLYGGAIDHCKLTYGLDSYNSGEVFDMIVHIDNDNTNSNISSDPFQICSCESNLPDCSMSWYNFPRTVYPGEIFQVSVVAVGQRNGTLPSRVISSIGNTQYPGDYLPSSQRLQQANNTCTKLNYTVFSLSQFMEIHLHAEGSPCPYTNTPYHAVSYANTPYVIYVDLNPTCPPGFNISESQKSCVCEPRLEHYTNNCTIMNGVGNITREGGQQFWIGYDNQSHGLILHPLCPYSYCVNDNVSFPLNESDMQCANNRSGLLCGACREGYSLVLGTSQCMKCTNSYLALLIPFAVMGVALVFFLFVCKLTVATGTLSGLVFYANIVGVNRTIFLPVESSDALSVSIAWLNLDFGIETCFYDGMDAYSKIWLQFVFPVYIWTLVGLIILVSRFSHRFPKLLGNNPVSVLATLILLSYTKILRTLIAAINITYLEYPTHNQSVWLYDANIDYLVGKHVPLFIMAVLVFLFLFLPYTLLLLFGQWLQAISHLRLFSWVNSARLKPFIDSYHAPYKPKHRYWPGLLLVLRFILLLVFALNPQEDPSVNLLAILVGTGILVAWAWVSGGVYRNWCLDALECSFALNLIVLVGATSYVNHSGGNQLGVPYTAFSIAFTTFIGILAYHIFQQLRHTKLWKKVPKLNLKSNRPKIVQAVNEPADNLAVEADFSQLREPLLEDLPQPKYGAF